MASRLLAAGWMALAALQTLAQDVTVLPIEWADPANPDDTLPVQTAPLAPKFPAELKQTTQIGWAEVDSFLDDQGEVYGREVQGTLPYFEDAVQAACAKARYAPAKYAGKRAGKRIQQVVLFNPASAALNGPDATPRLLRAGMIADPARNPSSEEMRPPPEVVWVLAQIDAAGHVTAVKGASPRLNKLIDEGIRDWRFAPARRGGSAVAAEIRVPVILVAPGGLVAKGMTPVRVLTRARCVILTRRTDGESPARWFSSLSWIPRVGSATSRLYGRPWTFLPSQLERQSRSGGSSRHIWMTCRLLPGCGRRLRSIIVVTPAARRKISGVAVRA
jgi:hypothetical protein